ncbi:MAG: hypothetical protein HY898_14700 [Deltaproteobacteria bacterium]|nr:hypothetical protein [Deltaproteobacteria bacterium]
MLATLETIAKNNESYRSLFSGESLLRNNAGGSWARVLKKSFATTARCSDLEPDARIAYCRAFHCDLLRYGRSDVDQLLDARDHQGGYEDTHVVIGLLLVRDNGCYDPEVLDKHVAAVAETLLAAQRNDEEFSDLYAERVVCLYWAGFGGAVRPEWMDRIRRSQNADGGWGLRPGEPSHPHTTANAALALTYYLEGKPAQATFYPAFPE